MNRQEQVRLASNPDPRVRRAIAERPDLTEEAAGVLATDSRLSIRLAVAKNGGAPPDVLRDLSADACWDVRWAALGIGAMDDAALLDAIDRSAEALIPVGQRGDRLGAPLLGRLFEATDPAGREQLAWATTNASILVRLASDESLRVRRAVAESSHADSLTFRRLTRDARAEVGVVVAHRHDLPPECLVELSRDRSALVRFNLLVAHHDNEALARLLADDVDPTVRVQARAILATSDDGGSPTVVGAEAGDALVGLSAIPVVLAVGSLRNHSGWNFELAATAAAVRGNRIRGLLVLVGAQMAAIGLALRGADSIAHATADHVLVLFSLVWLGAVLVFSAYRPTDVVRERPGDPGRHSSPHEFMERRSALIWVGSWVVGVLASACVALLGVVRR